MKSDRVGTDSRNLSEKLGGKAFIIRYLLGPVAEVRYFFSSLRDDSDIA